MSNPKNTRKKAPVGGCKRPASPFQSSLKASKKANTTSHSPAQSKGRLRKLPATINTDTESEEETLPHRSKKARSHNVVSDSDSGKDDHGDNDDLINKEQEPSDEELEGLNPDHLRKALTSEHPRWANPSDGDDGEASNLAPTTTEGVTSQATLSSKRALARQAEVPAWNKEASTTDEVLPSTDHTEVDSTVYGTSNNNSFDAVNAQWPPEAHYTPPPPGSRNISLMAQPIFMRTLIKAAIHLVTGDVLFEDTYPTVTSITDYFRNLLVRLASDVLDLDVLGQRITADSVLLDYISRLLSTHISSVRCNIKKTTSPKVESSFNLSGTVTERREQVRALLTSGDYIYPRLGNGLIFRTKPYHHPIMVSSLREAFFSAARGSLASKHASRFRSSLTSSPQSGELELPLPMVCATATAVYASIDDWNSGFLKKSEFNADAYEDIYRGHALFLERIRDERPCAYHRLMADLYNEVCNSQGSQSAHTVASNARAILDLAAMDE